MLVHIVCWKYRPEIAVETRDLHRSRLRSLKGLVPGIVSLDVGEDFLHLERSFDSGLVIRFSDREALDAYTDHLEHQKIAAMGKEISAQVVSVDFFTESPE